MINVENLNKSFDQNSNLSEAVKGNIEYLITIFNKHFEDVSLDNFMERLETLKISRVSKYLLDEPLRYDTSLNKIIINEKLLSSDKVDGRFYMMKAIIQMVTAEDRYYGFGEKPSMKALNEGFCEIMANNLVGNEGETTYVDEQIIVNSLGESIGLETFETAFFTHNSDLITKRMIMQNGNFGSVTGLLEEINNNMLTRRATNTSRLYFIQEKIMEHFSSGYNQIFAPETLETKSMNYSGYGNLVNYFNQQRLEAINDKRVK